MIELVTISKEKNSWSLDNKADPIWISFLNDQLTWTIASIIAYIKSYFIFILIG